MILCFFHCTSEAALRKSLVKDYLDDVALTILGLRLGLQIEQREFYFSKKEQRKISLSKKEQRDFLYWHILSKSRRSEKVHLSCTGWRPSKWEGWNYFEGWRTFEHWKSFTGSWHAIGGGERFGVCGWSFGSRIASWAFLKASDCYIISRDAKSWGPWTVF